MEQVELLRERFSPPRITPPPPTGHRDCRFKHLASPTASRYLQVFAKVHLFAVREHRHNKCLIYGDPGSKRGVTAVQVRWRCDDCDTFHQTNISGAEFIFIGCGAITDNKDLFNLLYKGWQVVPYCGTAECYNVFLLLGGDNYSRGGRSSCLDFESDEKDCIHKPIKCIFVEDNPTVVVNTSLVLQGFSPSMLRSCDMRTFECRVMENVFVRRDGVPVPVTNRRDGVFESKETRLKELVSAKLKKEQEEEEEEGEEEWE